MTGKLILVSGVSGAGKTTLIRFVVQHLNGLKYLTTTTTRPKRSDETDSIEYSFVTDAQYEELRAASKKWDHTEYMGYKYGADVGEVVAGINKGENYICSVVPDYELLVDMKELYTVKPELIWIDTPTEIAAQRVKGDLLRSVRAEDESAKNTLKRYLARSVLCSKTAQHS